jgi:hypothetical protein
MSMSDTTTFPTASATPSPTAADNTTAPQSNGAKITFQLPDGSNSSAQLDAEGTKNLMSLSQADREEQINQIAQHAWTVRRQSQDPASLTFQMPDRTSRSASVDPAFNNLPLDQQFAMVDRMRQVALSQSSANDSFSNDLAAGTGGAMHDVANLADAAGAHGFAGWLNNNAPSPDEGYTGRGGQILQDAGNGNYPRAAGDLAHAVVQGAPVLGTALAAGAVTDGAAAPAIIGGVLGAGEATGEHAKAAGRDTPDAADLLNANTALRAGTDAALSGTAFGRVGQLGKSVAGRLALATGASGAQNAADQYLSTGTIDPTQVGNAALAGGAIAGAGEAVGAARAGLNAASQRALQAARPDVVSDPQAIALHDANSAVSVATSTDPQASRTQIIRSVNKGLATQLTDHANDALASGYIDQPTAQAMRLAVNTAAAHTNTLLDNPGSPLQTVLASGAPAEIIQPFARGVRALQEVSNPGFLTQQTGPFQMIGRRAAQVGAVVGGAHNPITLGGALLAGKITGNVGAKVGAGIDGLLGTSQDTLGLDAANAARYLRKNDAAPNTSLQDDLGAAQRFAQGIPDVDPDTGVTRDTVPVNTPIRRGSTAARLAQAQQTQQSPALPAFQPSTASDVALGALQDGGQPTAGQPSWTVIPPSGGNAGALGSTSPVTPLDGPGVPLARAKSLLAQRQMEQSLNAPMAARWGDQASTKQPLGAPAGQAQPTQQSPLQAVQDKPVATAQGFREATLAGVSGAPGGTSAGQDFTPASRFIGNVIPGATHQSVMDAIQAMEAAGKVPAGFGTAVASGAPLHPALHSVARAVQGQMLGAGSGSTSGASTGGTKGRSDGPMLDAQGSPIQSLAAYQQAAPAYQHVQSELAQGARATGIPGLDAMVLDVGSIKTRDGRDATALAKSERAHVLLASLPADQQAVAQQYLLNPGLLNHG